MKVIEKQAVGDVTLGEDTNDQTVSADGVGESPAGPLSPEAEARLPELVQLLVQEQEHCADLIGPLTINDVEAFADRMRDTGTGFGYPPLASWGEKLLEQTAGFDMDGMAETLGSFGALVEALQARAPGGDSPS